MNSTTNTMNTIISNIGCLFSYIIAIGSICLGNVQAGIIFLFCLVLLTIVIVYLLANTNDMIKPINNILFDSEIGINISVISFTLLYIASSRMYNNEINSQYLGVVITSSLILLSYAFVIKYVKHLPYIGMYSFIFIISSILGMITSIVICGLNPQFIIVGNKTTDSSNNQCSTTPSSTFKCSFISNEDGTEINLDDVLNN